MGKDKPAKKPKPRRMTQSELDDLEFSEDKRLRRLGIDPDGDPVDIMRQLRESMIGRKNTAQHEGDEKKP